MTMTQPDPGASNLPSAPKPPPPNPKIQAVTFALELAKVRATMALPKSQAPTADELIADAEKISAFLGRSPA